MDIGEEKQQSLRVCMRQRKREEGKEINIKFEEWKEKEQKK